MVTNQISADQHLQFSPINSQTCVDNAQDLKQHTPLFLKIQFTEHDPKDTDLQCQKREISKNIYTINRVRNYPEHLISSTLSMFNLS